ncbi:MAG TPA: amidohydrolase family protein, partial [Acidimicrobiia bacterium]
APFTPTSIFEQLLALTTFISLDENGEACPAPSWLSGNEVSVESALRMMTIDGAAVMDLESDLGSLEVGKIADLAILANNPLDQNGMALLDNRVDSTWIGGQAAWCDGWAACALVVGPPPGLEGLTVTASSSRDEHVPERALDGSIQGESFWSSGTDAPGWIQVDFDEPTTLQGLRFTVFQNPESDTLHVLELRIEGEWVEVERFETFTATCDVLAWLPDGPVADVEGLRMTTLHSLSWPEWYEIEILR